MRGPSILEAASLRATAAKVPLSHLADSREVEALIAAPAVWMLHGAWALVHAVVATVWYNVV